MILTFLLFSAITGFGTEAQILESLNRPCYLQRPKYIQKTLYYLFKMTQGNYEPKIEMSLPRIDIIYVSRIGNMPFILNLRIWGHTPTVSYFINNPCCFIQGQKPSYLWLIFILITESVGLCQRVSDSVPDSDGCHSMFV